MLRELEHMMCVVILRQRLFILEERQLQGKWGRMGSYSCVQQPKVDRDTCSSGAYKKRTKRYMDRTGTRICRKGSPN